MLSIQIFFVYKYVPTLINMSVVYLQEYLEFTIVQNGNNKNTSYTANHFITQ